MNASSLGNSISSEAQTRFLQLRIDTFEKHLTDIYGSLCGYTRKTARVRDEGDDLALRMFHFAESDKINTSFRTGISNFAERFHLIQDFRDNQVQKLEENVMNEISLYGDSIRRAKEELRLNSVARNKLLAEQREGKPREMDKNTSFNEISRVHRAFELQIERFERKKITDMKKIFLNFIRAELKLYTNTLDLLSQSYKDVLSIDEDSDLSAFSAFFNFSQLQSPTNTNTKRPKSLDLDNASLTATLRRFNSTPSFVSSAAKNVSPESGKNLANNHNEKFGNN